MLRKLSDNNEYFFFEDKRKMEFRIYTLQNQSQRNGYISFA